MATLAGARMNGSSDSDARIATAKTTNTVCHGKNTIRPSAIGAPMTCPTDPTAVAIPRANERFSGDAARPTMARIRPNPDPAMPNPTRISSNWCWPGVTAKLDSKSPAA
jgi:hypothetical protein